MTAEHEFRLIQEAARWRREAERNRAAFLLATWICVALFLAAFWGWFLR